MNHLDQLKQYLNQLEERTFYNYVIGIVAGLLILMGLTVFMQYRNNTQLKKQAAKLNNYRDTAQELLSRYERVREQEQNVKRLLEQDKNFRIVGYLDTTLAQLQLAPHKTASTQTSEPLEHPANYTEITVNLTLSDINMRQLAELLREIEKNERIYTKSLEISKSTTRPTIDVAMTIATLQPRTEGVPA
jgi:uncharacterized membrane protein YhiD involved in acid resistance